MASTSERFRIQPTPESVKELTSLTCAFESVISATREVLTSNLHMRTPRDYMIEYAGERLENYRSLANPYSVADFAFSNEARRLAEKISDVLDGEPESQYRRDLEAVLKKLKADFNLE